MPSSTAGSAVEGCKDGPLESRITETGIEPVAMDDEELLLLDSWSLGWSCANTDSRGDPVDTEGCSNWEEEGGGSGGVKDEASPVREGAGAPAMADRKV